MMDFELFVAEKLQELRESSGSKKGVLPRFGYNSRWARKGTIAFSLSFFGMLLQFSDHFLDQHEKLWNFRCRFEHKHVVVNVFFPRGCPLVIYHIYHTENPKVKPWIFHIYVCLSQAKFQSVPPCCLNELNYYEILSTPMSFALIL